MNHLKNATIGLAIGFICVTIFTTIYTGINEGTKQLIVWGIASLLYGLSAVVFEIEKLNTLTKVIIHFCIALSITSSIAFFLYKSELISVIIGFIIAYIIIYVVMWQVEKYNIKQLNNKIEKNK